ncbi:MAG: helix-turn-helix domain-containing protein [Akkermansiaceae bacterium]
MPSLKQIPLIHTCWLKPFADYFSEKGVSLAPYCEEAQIALAFATTGEGWITKHQLYEFLQAIAIGEKMPEVGFVVGELITPDCLGDLGAAMDQAKTLAGVVRIFGELINRHVEGNFCWLEEGDDGEVWLFNKKSTSSEPGRVIADQAGLMSMINLVRLVAGKSWYPEKAALQTEPTRCHRKLPGIGKIEFEFEHNASGFAFPARWLLRPTEIHEVSHLENRQALGLLNEGEPVSTKLELLLREMMGVGGICPTLKLMADLCDTSPRSLHRQLKNEGSSYQQILDKIRFEQARSQLEKTELSIKELAYQLGFSGSNNFVRSFKRMSGFTPSQFRQANCRSKA